MRCLSLPEREELGGKFDCEDDDEDDDDDEEEYDDEEEREFEGLEDNDMRRGLVEKSRGRGMRLSADCRTSGRTGDERRWVDILIKGIRAKRRDMMVVSSKGECSK